MLVYADFVVFHAVSCMFGVANLKVHLQNDVIFNLTYSMRTDDLAGKVLNLGADWRLTDANGAIRPDARYNIQTDDGTDIFVQTIGLPPGKDGRTMLRGQFETATNGTYAWLNDVAAVGVLTRNGTKSVLIDMWEVSVR